MTVTLLAYTLLGVTLIAGALSVVANRATESSRSGPLSSYLLAGGALGRTSVVSLLISSSFGLNALFYAAWLGYSIGLYALLVQFAWSTSFFLLAKHAPTIRNHRSMHHLLGHSFGSTTRFIAGLCSLVGMMYLIGWETEIARLTFGNVLLDGGATAAVAGSGRGAVLAIGVVAACLLYTVLGGLRGNALADKILNLSKVVCVIIAIVVLAVVAARSPVFQSRTAWLPPWSSFIANMGLLGFITNVLFNLLWQFVDASSWQSIIAGRQEKPKDAATNVRASGIAIFIVPGIIGTVVGILMHSTEGVRPDNIIAGVTTLLSGLGSSLAVVSGVILIACVMSLLDGMFLACAFTLVVDVLYSKRSLDDIERSPIRAEAVLTGVRIALVVIALTAALGVHWLLGRLNLSVFQFVYVVIIMQLGLIGPVWIGLGQRRRAVAPMWLAIISAIGVGFLATWLGTHGWDPKWSDAAGTITAIVSLGMAYVLSRPSAAAGGTR